MSQILALSTKEWAKMSDLKKWTCMTALRGPDCYGAKDLTKWFTTGVIRYRMREIVRGTGISNSLLSFIPLPSYEWEAKGWNSLHFFYHIRQVVDVLDIPAIETPIRVWLGVTQEGKDRVKGFTRFLTHLQVEAQLPNSEISLAMVEEFQRVVEMVKADPDRYFYY